MMVVSMFMYLSPNTGKDVTCFAFGASGSGKTFTLWGTEEGASVSTQDKTTQ